MAPVNPPPWNKKRSKTQARKSVRVTYEEETLNPVSSNKFLFKNTHSFRRYTKDFANKKISGTFYFREEETDKIEREEMDQIQGYIDHWKWRPLIECTQPYLDLVTKVLYSNMELISDPWGIKTYFGHIEITITMDTITQVLNIPQGEDKFYPFKEFPENMGNFFEYKQWFGAVKQEDYISDTMLPAVHRVAYLFINNILTPKKDVKNVMEMNSIFCLKHLLNKELDLNIPFIIISHMWKAACSKTDSLPYPHILDLILDHYDIHFTSGQEVYQTPVNLVSKLHAKGWVKQGNWWRPNPKDPVNEWIRHPNAKINQYTDPEGNLERRAHLHRTPPASSNPQDHTPYFNPNLPHLPLPPHMLTNDLDSDIYLSKQIYDLSIRKKKFHDKLRDQIRRIRRFHEKYHSTWLNTFGFWGKKRTSQESVQEPSVNNKGKGIMMEKEPPRNFNPNKGVLLGEPRASTQYDDTDSDE